MPLLKLLHLASLICWCGILVYLPAMIAAGTRRNDQLFFRDHSHLTRMVFTLVGTPAALVAIGSGTAIILRDGVVAGWLVMKLTAVVGMTISHALCGVLLLRVERYPERSVRMPCFAVGTTIPLLIILTLWLVLAKPF
ncbi:CopD family protein [Stutzerimonas tarimensis]|uniref:Protoporphyrinogen IX oxidase n=1 Tax=Stutzerimonas tarimensis TaxID=1507735 RepID=A0ABV7TAL9_9GAMM